MLLRSGELQAVCSPILDGDMRRLDGVHKKIRIISKKNKVRCNDLNAEFSEHTMVGLHISSETPEL